jgi:hypothetical protein
LPIISQINVVQVRDGLAAMSSILSKPAHGTPPAAEIAFGALFLLLLWGEAVNMPLNG